MLCVSQWGEQPSKQHHRMQPLCLQGSLYVLWPGVIPKTWIQRNFAFVEQVQYLEVRAVCSHYQFGQIGRWCEMPVLQQLERNHAKNEVWSLGALDMCKVDSGNFLCAWLWQRRDSGIGASKEIQEELLCVLKTKCWNLRWLWLQRMP